MKSDSISLEAVKRELVGRMLYLIQAVPILEFLLFLLKQRGN
jgi:hypothetical protein